MPHHSASVDKSHAQAIAEMENNRLQVFTSTPLVLSFLPFGSGPILPGPEKEGRTLCSSHQKDT